MRRLPLLASVLALACGGSPSPAPVTPETAEAPAAARVHAHVDSVTPRAAVAAAVSAPDRTDDDRALDGGRHPAEVLSFFGIEPGQRVAELFAGGGYTTELLARAVGPSGLVLAQNDTFILDRFARGPLTQRLERLAMPQIVAVELPFDAPLPPDATSLDAVLFVLSYHDTAWMQVDRAAMNRAVFAALRPGGVYGIVDHAAAEGHGVDDVQTLHRIEESVVIDEVTAAGFVLESELDVLRNPTDPHDWNDSPREAGERRGTSDRFVLRFVHP